MTIMMTLTMRTMVCKDKGLECKQQSFACQKKEKKNSGKNKENGEYMLKTKLTS